MGRIRDISSLLADWWRAGAVLVFVLGFTTLLWGCAVALILAVLLEVVFKSSESVEGWLLLTSIIWLPLAWGSVSESLKRDIPDPKPENTQARRGIAKYLRKP